jgi:hypothetical protein
MGRLLSLAIWRQNTPPDPCHGGAVLFLCAARQLALPPSTFQPTTVNTVWREALQVAYCFLFWGSGQYSVFHPQADDGSA